MKTNSKKIAQLLSDLSKDPKIKTAIDQLKSNYSADPAHKISNIKDIALVALKLGAKFTGRKGARLVQETLDAIGLLIQISFLVKTNIFDRPEVQAFFKEMWSGIQMNSSVAFSAAKSYVDRQLEKIKKRPMKDVTKTKKDTASEE